MKFTTFLAMIAMVFAPLSAYGQADPDLVQATFYNRLTETVELYYIDGQGQRVKVDELAPEEKTTHETYVGDIFLVTDPYGMEYGPFEVNYDGETKSIYDLNHDDAVQVTITNNLKEDIYLYWFPAGGEEMTAVGPALKAGESMKQTSWIGHVFVAQTDDGTDVGEILMDDNEETFTIDPK